MFRESLGLSQLAFARQTNVSQGTISQAELGVSGPSKRLIETLSSRFHVNADWLLYGRGDMLHEPEPGFPSRLSRRRIEAPDYARPGQGDFRADGEEYALIERMDLSVSAGNGLEPVQGGQGERLAFSQSWLSRNRINADLAVLVRVKGDSMAPGIPDGALALVHVAENEVRQEGVYAFNRADLSFIKRLAPLDRIEDGQLRGLVIISDNPAYSQQVVYGEDLEDIRVVGRVRCVMTTL